MPQNKYLVVLWCHRVGASAWMHVRTFYKTKNISPSGKKCFNSENWCRFLVGRCGEGRVTGWLRKNLFMCWCFDGAALKGILKLLPFRLHGTYLYVMVASSLPLRSRESTRKQKGLKYKYVPCFSSSPSVTERSTVRSVLMHNVSSILFI